MSDSTPQQPTPAEGEGAAETPASTKKTPARKSAKATPASAARSGSKSAKPATKRKAPTSPAEAEAQGAEVTATPDPEPAPTSSTPAAPTGAATTPGHDRSILDGVRDNPVGPLAAGLVVAIAVGLLLSVLVPNDPSALAMIILGALLAAAVGFAVRLVSTERGLRRQVEAFLAVVIGVHLMAVTGTVGGEIPLLSDLGASGPGFNEALIVALATPAASTGTLLAGLTAVIIVGWGRTRH